MRNTLILIMASYFVICTMDASVTVNTGKGTYDIDASGCVDHGKDTKRPKTDVKKKEVKEKSRG